MSACRRLHAVRALPRPAPAPDSKPKVTKGGHAPAPHSRRSEEAYSAGVPGGVHELPVTQCLQGAGAAHQYGGYSCNVCALSCSCYLRVKGVACCGRGSIVCAPGTDSRESGRQRPAGAASPLHHTAGVHAIASQPVRHEVIVAVRGGAGVVGVALQGLGGASGSLGRLRRRADTYAIVGGGCQVQLSLSEASMRPMLASSEEDESDPSNSAQRATAVLSLRAVRSPFRAGPPPRE